MYKFVRVKYTGKRNFISKIYPWQLMCSDAETLIKHTEIYHNKTLTEGLYDFFGMNKDGTIDKNWKGFKKSHYKSDISGAIGTLRAATGKPINEIISMFCDEAFQGKLRTILRFGAILLNKSGSYMAFREEDFKIIYQKESEKMIYPSNEFTKEDIRIFQWPGGSHWYAKIANIDVIGDGGNQCWNTWSEAKRQAVNMLERI